MTSKRRPRHWDVRSTGWSHRQNHEDPLTKQELHDRHQPSP
ncbi:unnamed protein product [Brassica oleracea]